ncbi:MAG: hypothetical protein JWR40_2845 [Massilia sp.]|nr:hypothetical protein [Massilia sp.]MDB5948474.1 hypothetical protein [Massilia sp.]
MKPRAYRWTALTLALPCLLLLACKGKNDPVKPTVAQSAVVAPAAAR